MVRVPVGGVFTLLSAHKEILDVQRHSLAVAADEIHRKLYLELALTRGPVKAADQLLWCAHDIIGEREVSASGVIRLAGDGVRRSDVRQQSALKCRCDGQATARSDGGCEVLERRPE